MAWANLRDGATSHKARFKIMQQTWPLPLKIGFETWHPKRISEEVPILLSQSSS
jgi:hypothetical protein